MTDILKTILIVGALAIALAWGMKSCSDKQDATDKAARLQAEKASDSTAQIFRILLAEKEISNLVSQRAQAASQALLDMQNRTDRDNQTALLIGMMNRPSQDNTALRYLVENGFLTKDRLPDTLGTIRKDSSYTAAVAIQGRVLSDTRAEVKQLGEAFRNTQQQVSDLETILNKTDQGITSTMDYVDERIEERGLFRAKSKRQFKEVNRKLKASRPLKP